MPTVFIRQVRGREERGALKGGKQKKSSLGNRPYGAGVPGMRRPFHKLRARYLRVMGVRRGYGTGQPASGAGRDPKPLNWQLAQIWGLRVIMEESTR